MRHETAPVYDRQAGPAHLIRVPVQEGGPALCGVRPDWPYYWFGGNSTEECIHVTGLKTCDGCLSAWEAMSNDG